jgi:branched-chain amino acid transport system permease protein
VAYGHPDNKLSGPPLLIMTRWRPYLLGLLGIAAITFPFLWLQLQPDFKDNTIQVTWAPAHGLQFFDDLLPVFIVGLVIWLGIRAGRHWHLHDALTKSTSWQHAARVWDSLWMWIVMPLVLCGPFFLSASNVGLLTNAGIYMLLALGLNITVGMTGLLVLGYAGFYAFGAYFFAVTQEHVSFFPWWLAALLAFPLGGVVGYLLGLPCLRLRGDYLAIVTLGFAEAFRETIRNLDFTHGDQGISVTNGNMFRGFAGLGHGQASYIYTALILFLAVFLIQRLYHSPVGRAWIAIRENEIAAAAVGVPVVRMKLLAFSLSAAVAAVAGVLSGANDAFVSPVLCEFHQSIMVLAMVILGGLGNSYGALLGAALLFLVPEYLKRIALLQDNATFNAIVPGFLRKSLAHLPDYQLLLFGGIMVLMMLYRPQGLVGSSRRKEEILNE